MAAPEDAHDAHVRALLPPGLRSHLGEVSALPATWRAPHGVEPAEAAQLRRLAEYLGAAPASTVRSYTFDWRRWRAWCRANTRRVLPADPADVALYLAGAYRTNPATGRMAHAPATLQRWAAAIAATHSAHGHPAPTRQPPARQVLRLLRAATRAQPTTPTLTDAEFSRLLGALGPDTWPQASARRRDRLILTLARQSGLGPEPLLALELGQVGFEPQPPALRLHLEEATLHLEALEPGQDHRGCVVCAFVAWRELLDIAQQATTAQVRAAFARLPSHHLTAGQHLCQHPPPLAPTRTGPLLRRLYRGGAIGAIHPSPQTVKLLVHTYAQRAGLKVAGLSALSLRRQTPAYPRPTSSPRSSRR